jgi:hypothetical protein
MEEKESYFAAALAKLVHFSQDEWLCWIAGTLNNTYCDPVIGLPRAEEINSLFWVFNHLSANKTPLYQEALNNYCVCAIKYMELVAPLEDNYPVIFTLIHFINGARPFMCRRPIEQLIRASSFENCVYNNVNLNYFLIKAYIPIEDSVHKPLHPLLDRKLKTAKHPYFYYVYFKYQDKYFDLKRGCQQLFASEIIVSEKVAAEISFAFKEIVVNSKSYVAVNDVFEAFLRGQEPIPQQLNDIIRPFEMVVDYIQQREDSSLVEQGEECLRLMVKLRRAIIRQTAERSLVQASPGQGSAPGAGPIGTAVLAYGSDAEMLRLVFDGKP